MQWKFSNCRFPVRPQFRWDLQLKSKLLIVHISIWLKLTALKLRKILSCLIAGCATLTLCDYGIFPTIFSLIATIFDVFTKLIFISINLRNTCIIFSVTYCSLLWPEFHHCLRSLHCLLFHGWPVNRANPAYWVPYMPVNTIFIITKQDLWKYFDCRSLFFQKVMLFLSYMATIVKSMDLVHVPNTDIYFMDWRKICRREVNQIYSALK